MYVTTNEHIFFGFVQGVDPRIPQNVMVKESATDFILT